MAKGLTRLNVNSNAGTQDRGGVGLTIRDIPIGDIKIHDNIRKHYEGIEELAESVKQVGLLQPIIVYPVDGNFIVKTGHRRFKAFCLLYQQDKDKFHSIRCIISTADNLAIVQLVENTQREDLSPIDLYNALTALREQRMSNQEIAQVMGKGKAYVDNLFSAVNEVQENPKIAEKIYAGVSLQDIAETKGIQDEQARLELLDQHQNGEINRVEMRQKKKELKAPPVADKVDTPAIPDVEYTVKISRSKDELTVETVFDNKDNAFLFEKEIRKYFNKHKIKIAD